MSGGEWRLNVKVDEIRAILDKLLTYLAENNGETLSIDQDYFWSIGPADIYDISKRPVELGIGQLSESWDNIRNLTDEDADPIPYDLVWLADILRALGQRTPP